MNWNRILLHDLRRGILRKRLLIPCIQFMLLYLFYWLGRRGMYGSLSPADYLFYAFSGIPRVDVFRADSFHLPTIWLQIMACPLYLNLSYPLSDLTKEGEQILVRSGSRVRWFLSKCIWNLSSSLTYVAIAAAAAFIMSAVTGGPLTMTCNPNLVAMKADLPLNHNITGFASFLALLILPLLTISALNMLQMVLSFFVKPIYSFLFCMTVIVASIWGVTPVLLGNGTMVLRNGTFFVGGLSPVVSAVIALMVILCSIPAGVWKFQKYDVLPTMERE